jgi:predicted nuclease of restriction endonuclease-like RecB superfamily
VFNVLPSDLLVARKYRDTIYPVYAKINDVNLVLAERLIQAFNAHLMKRKREMEEAIAGLEELGYDYRFVRGLAVLLERRCQFEVEAAVKPRILRSRLFHATSKEGVPSTLRERWRLLSEEAKHHGVSVQEVETSLYADLDEELVLTAFDSIDADALVRRYNLSLTQTLLFRSSEMEFTASGNWQRIFFNDTATTEIYTIQRQREEYWVKVDGPISLFKLGHR